MVTIVRHPGWVRQELAGRGAQSIAVACAVLLALVLLSVAVTVHPVGHAQASGAVPATGVEGAASPHSAGATVRSASDDRVAVSLSDFSTSDSTTGSGEVGDGDVTGGEHSPGGGHHHHGGEHGAPPWLSDSLTRTGSQMTVELSGGYLGVVRAAGGRERPD